MGIGIEDREQTSVKISYYYTPLNYNFLHWTICVIHETDAKLISLQNIDPATAPFVYHRYDLYEPKLPACRHFYTQPPPPKDTSVVKLSDRAFKDITGYIVTEETTVFVAHINSKIRGSHVIIHDEVAEEIARTDKLNDWWVASNLTYVAWVCIATFTGTLRCFPGFVDFNKYYDPRSDYAYHGVTKEPSLLGIHYAFEDQDGGGFNTHLIKALTRESQVLGVLYVQFTMHFIQDLLESSVSYCAENRNSSCFVTDSNGHFILYPTWSYPTWSYPNLSYPEGSELPEISPKTKIQDLEPDIANDMLRKGYMTVIKSVDVIYRELFKPTRYYLDFDRIDDGNGYIAARVNGTDAFLFIKYDEAKVSKLGESECEDCFYRADASLSPCTSEINVKDWTISRRWSSRFLHRGSDVSNQYKGLDTCLNQNCTSASNQTSCNLMSYCRWCAYTTQGTGLQVPFCARMDQCWYGQLGQVCPREYYRKLGEKCHGAVSEEPEIDYLLLSAYVLQAVGVVLLLCVLGICWTRRMTTKRRRAKRELQKRDNKEEDIQEEERDRNSLHTSGKDLYFSKKKLYSSKKRENMGENIQIEEHNRNPLHRSGEELYSSKKKLYSSKKRENTREDIQAKEEEERDRDPLRDSNVSNRDIDVSNRDIDISNQYKGLDTCLNQDCTWNPTSSGQDLYCSNKREIIREDIQAVEEEERDRNPLHTSGEDLYSSKNLVKEWKKRSFQEYAL